MARHASPIKEQRKSARRHARNLYHLSAMARSIKSIARAIEEKDAAKVRELLPQVVSRIHHTASRGVIHRNEASRRVSRLTKRVNAFLSAPA